MTFTYVPGSTDAIHDVRAAIGDTDPAAPSNERLEDEEIERFVTVHGSTLGATVAAARALMAKLSRRATEKMLASARVVYAKRVDGLRDLIRDLERDAAGLAKPYAGGISVSDRDAVLSNTDRVEPAFSVGMLDNPRAVE